MNRVMRLGGAVVGVWLMSAAPVAAGVKTDSLVKVFVNKNSMDYLNPWQSHGGQMVTGSGCIIAGNRILTNAHVVNDYTFIQVRRESDPEKYAATVEAIGQDYDLAILRVEDPDFFKGVTPLEFGGLPNLQDAVTAFGYPMGGDQLSITTGVVSRVEIISYVQSRRQLLGVQIDAAINPGNSGGPVLKGDQIVGIAMQELPSSQSIGYMIPVPVIAHFLEDVKRGGYVGVPELGILGHNTENKSMRRYYALSDKVGGVVVAHVVPYSSVDGLLQEGDVILELDGTPISSDGTVPFRDTERVDMSYVISSKYVGDEVGVQYVRGGKTAEMKLTLKPSADLVPIPNSYKKPSYYIYGGLTFTVLSADLMDEFRRMPFGGESDALLPLTFRYYTSGAGALNEKRNKALVVLSEVLPDAINVGYHEHQVELITKVNGQEFSSFKEFVTLVENTKDEYVQFENEGKQKIIISVKDAQRANDDILKRNHVPSRCSDDVALWLKH